MVSLTLKLTLTIGLGTRWKWKECITDFVRHDYKERDCTRFRGRRCTFYDTVYASIKKLTNQLQILS
jgi:hypothetical protein